MSPSTNILVSAVLLFSLVGCDIKTAKDKSQSKGETSLTPEDNLACVSGLNIKLLPESGWRKGSYTFKITARDGVTTCKGSLPLDPCGDMPSLECNNENFFVSESGCALPANAHTFAAIFSEHDYPEVEVEISYENAIAITKKFQFDFKEVKIGSQKCKQAPEQSLFVPQE